MVPVHPLKILFVMSGWQWQDNDLQNTESDVLCVLLLNPLTLPSPLGEEETPFPFGGRAGDEG